ncbi:ankrd29, partial [Symbiodinium pilosum]
MSDLDAAGSPSIALPRPEESGAQHLCQDAESLEGQRSGRVYFNGLSGPLDPSMDKMTLQEAPSCLYGVRLHFHQKRGVSFFAVKVFISSRDTEVIDRNATYTDLGEPEDFFVVLANPGTEKAKDLFDAAEAPREDEALPKLEKALEEVHANVLDARGETAACKACRCGHVRMLYSLQLALADFTLADSQGASPLFLACQEGHVQCARFLLELCGTKKVCIRPDGGPEVWVDFVDRPLNSDATSLYVASQNGHRGTVQLLIQYRAKVNQATRDKATPLFIASQMGFTGIVDDLIEANASVDAANNTGATPLFIASQNARLEIAQKL